MDFATIGTPGGFLPIFDALRFDGGARRLIKSFEYLWAMFDLGVSTGKNLFIRLASIYLKCALCKVQRVYLIREVSSPWTPKLNKYRTSTPNTEMNCHFLVWAPNQQMSKYLLRSNLATPIHKTSKSSIQTANYILILRRP